MQIKSPLQEQVPVNVMKPAVEAFQNTKKNNRHLGENPVPVVFLYSDFNPSHSLGYGKNQNQYQTYRSNPFQHNGVEFFHLKSSV